jgi:hypothetical protein
VTRTDRHAFIPILLTLCLLLAAGCLDTNAKPSPEPGGRDESEQIIRRGWSGPVVVTFSSSPLARGAPPDGVRAALLRALGDDECSAATFHWSARARSMRWIQERLEERRKIGRPPRLILAGHGLGATEAAETAREIMFDDRDVEIVLLVTVDAVKTGKIGGAAGVTGNAIARRIPGVDLNFTAYDAAPEPDGRQLWTHVNYYQAKSVYFHGSSMPYAENHRVDDWTGLLNHANADDFALPFLVADFREALRRAKAPPLPPARTRGGE